MIKSARKWRQRFWRWQIILGDVIALLNRRFCRRWVQKKALKRSGKMWKRLIG